MRGTGTEAEKEKHTGDDENTRKINSQQQTEGESE
jgi:hypothetical protein